MYDEADKLALCGEQPVNPNDVEGEAEVGVEGGPEDDGDQGRPDDASKPADAGRPDDAGPDS